MEQRLKVQIAFNLRRLRAERGVSLAEVARRAGVSRGTLTRLEAGEGNPTVDTLGTLARSLGVELEELLTDREAETLVVRPSQDAWARGHAVSMRAIDRMLERAVVDVYEAVFEAGLRRESRGHVAGTREYLFVIEGRLLAGPEGEAVELEAGEYIRFAADRAHVYEAVGAPARALLMMSYLEAPSDRQEMQRELEHLVSERDREERVSHPEPPTTS
jgi:transcriptional regulator with XRE-family HTH domain